MTNIHLDLQMKRVLAADAVRGFLLDGFEVFVSFLAAEMFHLLNPSSKEILTKKVCLSS